MKDLWDRSFEGEIEVEKVRRTLSFKFHLGKANINSLIKEMMALNLVDYDDCKTILLIWKPKS